MPDLKPPSPRGQCWDCGKDARGKLGESWYLEDYNDGPDGHLHDKRVRFCKSCAATLREEQGGDGWQ